MSPLLHEVVAELLQAVDESRPRFLSGFEHQRAAALSNLDLFSFEVKLLRNADSLAVAALEYFRSFHRGSMVNLYIRKDIHAARLGQRPAFHDAHRLLSLRRFRPAPQYRLSTQRMGCWRALSPFAQP